VVEPKEIYKFGQVLRLMKVVNLPPRTDFKDYKFITELQIALPYYFKENEMLACL